MATDEFLDRLKIRAFRCSAHTELLTLTVQKVRRLAVDQSSLNCEQGESIERSRENEVTG